MDSERSSAGTLEIPAAIASSPRSISSASALFSSVMLLLLHACSLSLCAVSTS